MTAQTVLQYTVNLNKGLVLTPIPAILATEDDAAHTFIVSAVKDGEPQSLTGADVRGFFIRPDSVTVPINGTVDEEGNATVTLIARCYAIAGRFQLAIRIVQGDVKSVIFCGDGSLRKVSTDAFIDEEGIIPSLDELLAQIATIEAAVSNANAAAENANEAADRANNAQGPVGPTGATPNLTIGTVETLEAGSNATATITGTAEDPVLNLGIPKGVDGDGADGTVQSVNGKTGAVQLDAEDVGARPDNWMPTAEDVGARPDNWMPTAEDVGAAAAGYGYGEQIISMGEIFADETALNTALDNMLSTMNNNETKQVSFKITAVGSFAIGDWIWSGTLFKSSANYAILSADSSFAKQTRIGKVKYNGAWQPWEWVNPPMIMGAEYRTTERWNGMAVYTKLIGLGEATDGKAIEWGITKSKLLSVNVVLDTYPLRQRTAGETATGSDYYATYYVTGASITIYCGASIAGKPVYAHIRYIK